MPIPNVSTLYERLYKGSEGGLEFARLLNLLLISESPAQGFQFITSSDASGDYKGVDGIIRNDEQIGVQYKFFPVPLSSNHKRLIKESLETALRKFPEMNKWILIIPHNPDKFTLEFLDGLSKEKNMIIECWGHLRILDLMLKHPQIGSKYYPELRTIQIEEHPTNEMALSYFNQFIDPKMDVRTLFFKAQPNISDCKTVFTEKYYKEISDFYYYSFRETIEDNQNFNLEEKNRIVIKSYTLSDIRNSSVQLPGGMYDLFQEYDALHPGVRFYAISFIKDDNTAGMSYSIWCYINDRWVFFPTPWRIMWKIKELSNNKDVRFLIRLLRFFRVHKSSQISKKRDSFLLTNYVINQLYN